MPTNKGGRTKLANTWEPWQTLTADNASSCQGTSHHKLLLCCVEFPPLGVATQIDFKCASGLKDSLTPTFRRICETFNKHPLRICHS